MVKLDARMFIYSLILKTPSLACVCVFALGHSYVFMCISVPVRYLEMIDKFRRKNYFYNPTHTIFKLRLLENWDFSQKNFEKQVISKKTQKTKTKKWKLAPVAQVLKKKKLLRIKGYWQVYFSNFSSWNIFLYIFADMKVSVLIKHWFLVLKNLNRFSI